MNLKSMEEISNETEKSICGCINNNKFEKNEVEKIIDCIEKLKTKLPK